MVDRKPDREITDKEELQFVLERAQILRLGMCRENQPYMVPMNYGIDGDTLYLHSASTGKKIDYLRANPSVCFEVETGTALVEADAPCGWTMKYKSIVGYGTIHFVTDPEEKIHGLKRLMAHYTNKTFKNEEFHPKAVAKATVLKLEIESMRGARHGYDD